MLDKLIGIIGVPIMIISLVVICYQRRRMSREYAAREADGQRAE